MSGAVEQAKAEIRFALSQLPARNGHHEFETLARMLARATVTRNVLPATGPVSAGGDQSRDFETYRTEMAGQTQRLGRELGMRDGDGVGFICTLQHADIGSKIRGDVDGIMSDGTTVKFVLAYCEVNIPVGRRHDLQRHVREKHAVHLEIFDGNGIAELLAHHATFWVAEEILRLPGRVLPPPPDRPGWYEADLVRWRSVSEPVFTWGHYVDIKGCLQYAYLTRESREDIPFWLEKLAPLLETGTSEQTRHAARHQVILASHLGLGAMRAVDHLVAEEIEAALVSSEAHMIGDAAVLLLLVCAANARDETDHTADQIMTWNRALTQRIGELLDAGPHAGETCSLLESLAALKMQPDLDQAAADGLSYSAADATIDFTMDERLQAVAENSMAPIDIPAIDVSGALDAYTRLAATLPHAPLYPVEHASRFLTLHTLLFADEPRFDELVDVFDRHLAASLGEEAVAEKALGRANALFSARRVLDCLRHLHRAQLCLFHGEAGPRLIHAILATAEAYQQLKLYSAAKYFGLVAAYLAQRNDSELFAEGLFKAAAADYHQGNWVSSTQFAQTALVAHGLLAEQAFDPERHAWVPAAMFELTNVKALSDKLGTPYKDFVDGAIAQAGVAGLLDSFLDGASRRRRPWWTDVDADSFVLHATEQFGRPPFCDAGPRRRLRFQCLGVTWTIEFANARPDVAVGERLAATLQIMLAHVAPADPALLPTSVRVIVTGAPPGTAPEIEETGSTPTETRFNCSLATVEHRSPEAYNTVARETLSAAAKIAVVVSTRSDADWQSMLDSALEQDLMSIATFGMPYDIAFSAATGEHPLHLELDEQMSSDDDSFCPEPGRNLDSPTTPGPGYDQSRSREEVRFKYETLPTLMRPTLAALTRTPDFVASVATLRERGWLDWHILIAIHNVAKNTRFKFRSRIPLDDPEAIRDFFYAPEPENDPVPARFFPMSALEQALAFTLPASATAIWNLSIRQQSIDTEALQQLLAARYGWTTDDVEHDDPFEVPPED